MSHNKGKSAFTEVLAKRPAFVRLLADAKARKFDVVVVYMYDRFGRKMRVALQAIHELEQSGVKVESATESNDWLSTGVSLLMAEQYSRMLSKRMADVRQHETRAGRWVGGVPVGYDRVNGILVANEHIAAAKLAGELYRTGTYGAGYIAQALNDAGYTMPDGSPFKKTAVEELLKSPAYAGLVVCGDLIVPGKHEAVWSEEDWARIQEVAATRSRRRTSYNAPFHPLLAGLMVCGGCGAPMWHQPNGKFRYYRCAACINGVEGPIPGLQCDGTYARAASIETQVLAWIGGLALTPDLMADVRRLLSTPATRPTPPHVDIDTKLKRLARAYADGAYSDKEYDARRATLLAALEPTPETPRQDDDRALMALIANLPTLLTETTNEYRQAILRELITEVYGRKDALLALRPTRLAETLLHAAAERADWPERAKAVLTECSAGGPGGHLAHVPTHRIPYCIPGA